MSREYDPDQPSLRPAAMPVEAKVRYVAPRLQPLGELSRLTGGSAPGVGESIGGGEIRRL